MLDDECGPKVLAWDPAWKKFVNSMTCPHASAVTLPGLIPGTGRSAVDLIRQNYAEFANWALILILYHFRRRCSHLSLIPVTKKEAWWSQLIVQLIVLDSQPIFGPVCSQHSSPPLLGGKGSVLCTAQVSVSSESKFGWEECLAESTANSCLSQPFAKSSPSPADSADKLGLLPLAQWVLSTKKSGKIRRLTA